MSKIKVINKGYTLQVTSWENDGDSYQTKSKTVDTIEEVKLLHSLLQLCTSENNNPPGVIRLGNSVGGFSEDQEDLLRGFFIENNIDFEDEEGEYIHEAFMEEVGDLLGGSEFYTCRVFDSCSVTYSPEDVYLEEVKL